MIEGNNIVLGKGEKVAIISDIHLGSKMESTEGLHHILSTYDFIVFNGDIFELYVHKYNDLCKKNDAVIMLTKWMEHNPTKFVYVVGNHDEALWNMTDLGFRVFQTARIVTGSNIINIIHGHQFDDLNREPPAWVKLWVLFEYWINRIFRINIQRRVAERKTTFSKLVSKKQKKALLKIRKNARNYAFENNITYLIHGHTHLKSTSQYNLEGIRTIIDQGSFVIGRSYVEVYQGYPKTIILEDIKNGK